MLYSICEYKYIAGCVCVCCLGEFSFLVSVHGVERHMSVENSWDTDSESSKVCIVNMAIPGTVILL